MAYRENAAYQNPATPPKPEVLSALLSASPSSASSLETHAEHRGKGPNYSTFVSYFLSEIGRLGGIQQTLNEHLFSGTDVAEDLLVRLHAGFLHPLIHLMYGLEFEVPEIVAQALSQAAVHKDNLKEFLLGSEKMAREGGVKGMGSIEELYDEVRRDEKLAHSARFSDDQKITDGVLVRAKDEMLAVAAKVAVKEEDVEERMWEMYEMAAYMTLGSSGFMPEKREKIDFFFMHHINSAPFYISLLNSQSISTAAKARVLEWKIRLDLIQYAARRAPPLTFDHLTGPSSTVKSISPKDAIGKIHYLNDDGHSIKLLRAMEVLRTRAGASASSKTKIGKHFSGEGVWEKLFGLVVQTTGRQGESRWVRSIGMEEAWKAIPNKDSTK